MKKVLLLLFSLMLFISSCSAGGTDLVNGGIKAGQVIKTINKGKAVLIKDLIITDDLDFTLIVNHEIFSSSLETARTDVPVTFLNCIFMGKVIANGTESGRQVRVHFGHTLTFEACDFRQEVNFDNVTVEGEVNFTGATFREPARFNNVHFKGKNNWFTAVISEKNFSMQEALINGSCDFFKAQTKGKTSFQSTEFNGLARFSDLEADGACDFSLVRFRDDALFTYSNFSGDFRMTNAMILGRLDLNSCEFQANAYLSESRFFGPVNFSKSNVKGFFDLSSAAFYSDNPDFTEFSILKPDQLNTKGIRVVQYNSSLPFETNPKVKTN